MTKLQFLLLRTRAFFSPPKILLDGFDNTITINSSLYRILQSLGIEQHNHIYMSLLMNIPNHPDSYAFCILPSNMDPQATITRELQYNTHYNTFGFEAACPTIQQIFYSWDLSPDSRIRTSVSLHQSSSGTIFFLINQP